MVDEKKPFPASLCSIILNEMNYIIPSQIYNARKKQHVSIEAEP
jgi:hypothetical protein